MSLSPTDIQPVCDSFSQSLIHRPIGSYNCSNSQSLNRLFTHQFSQTQNISRSDCYSQNHPTNHSVIIHTVILHFIQSFIHSISYIIIHKVSLSDTEPFTYLFSQRVSKSVTQFFSPTSSQSLRHSDTNINQSDRQPQSNSFGHSTSLSFTQLFIHKLSQPFYQSCIVISQSDSQSKIHSASQ